MPFTTRALIAGFISKAAVSYLATLTNEDFEILEASAGDEITTKTGMKPPSEPPNAEHWVHRHAGNLIEYSIQSKLDLSEKTIALVNTKYKNTITYLSNKHVDLENTQDDPTPSNSDVKYGGFKGVRKW